MEEKVAEQFTDEILDESLKRYGINRSNARRLGGFESFFYDCNFKNKKIVLRFTHNTHRTESAIKGEIEFIEFLSNHGIDVPKIIISPKKKLIEVVGKGKSKFFIVAFEKIKGKQRDINKYDEGMVIKYGRLLGRIHHLSKEFKPKNKRFSWSNSNQYNLDKYLPNDHKNIITKANKLLEFLNRLSKSKYSYGLIHNDAHTGNILVSDKKMTLIDFDDCMYSWHISDIAIVIFNALVFNSDLLANPNRKIRFITDFLTLFMKGYRKENKLDKKWMKQIPHFLKLQELSLYLTIYKSNLDLGKKGDSFVRNFMNKRKQRLEKGTEFIDMDFSEF